jgi:excisionase family DNA binding protein
MDGLMSLSRAAEVLDISIWTIRAWVQQGKIQSVKLGARRMIRESEISRVITEGINNEVEEGESDLSKRMVSGNNRRQQ